HQNINKIFTVDHKPPGFAGFRADESITPLFPRHSKQLGWRRLLRTKQASTEKDDKLITGKQASSSWISKGIQVVNAEEQPKLKITEKQGMRTSMKFVLTRLASLQKTSTKKKIVESSNASTWSNDPTPSKTSPPFWSSHSTQSIEEEDATGDVTQMDYTPAQRKPPIHNK
ncbi:hypothetical protein KI387_023749, partial [Taxus chinensis]